MCFQDHVPYLLIEFSLELCFYTENTYTDLWKWFWRLRTVQECTGGQSYGEWGDCFRHSFFSSKEGNNMAQSQMCEVGVTLSTRILDPDIVYGNSWEICNFSSHDLF